MNFFRPKLFMSFLLIAMLSFAAAGSVFAQDLGVGAINVRANGQTGHYPILLDATGSNSIDVLVTNYDAANRNSATFSVDLEISWPNQVGGPLVLTKYFTSAQTKAFGESFVVSWTGTELHLGNFNFDRRIIYTLDARIYNIMNSADGDAGNDRMSDFLAVRKVAPVFTTPTITINGDPLANADFTNFSYLGDYLTASGLYGNLEVIVASGLHDDMANMNLSGTNFDTDNAYTVTFSGRKNYPALVNISSPAGLIATPSPWLWNIKDLNFKLNDLTLTVDHTPAQGEGGQALYIQNSSAVTNYSYEINGCVFNGVAVPEVADNNFTVVYCDGQYMDSFEFNNNTVYGGWRALVVGSDMDPDAVGIPLHVMNNKFYNFTNSGVYVERPAVTLPVNYEGGMFTGNLFQTMSFTGYGLYTSNLSMVENNTFNLIGSGGSAVALAVVHDPAYVTPAVIENNVIANGARDTYFGWLLESASMGGIYVTNAKKAIIKNNTVVIKNAAAQQGINITGGGLDLVEHFSLVDHNTVNMKTEGSAVSISGGAYAKVYYNDLKAASAASASARYVISTNASTGIVANNMCSATFSEGIVSTNDVNMNFYYNTIDVVTGAANTDAGFLLSGGTITGKRNMVVNHGTGASSYAARIAVNPVAAVIDENNYWSFNAGNFNNLLGAGFATIAAWRGASGQDAMSTNAPVIYDADGRLIYEFFDDDGDSNTVGPYGGYNAGVYSGIYYANPLFAADDPLHTEFEMYNFYGELRNGYYAGNINLIPTVEIATQPVDITSCYGEDHMLQVVAECTFNAKPWYQWYKDDVPMVGETTAILLLDDLNWDMAGAYKCLLSGQGGTEPEFSAEVLVITIGTTEVTRQPKSQAGSLGKSLMFEVEAHIHGFQDDPENELNQPLIQWYQYDGTVGTELEDTDGQAYNIVAGSKSSLLTISNMSEEAWTTPYQYYARLLGFCDYDEFGNPVYVYTDTVSVMSPPSISITAQPQSQTICVGDSLALAAAYDEIGEVESVDIQWMLGGTPISGAKTLDFAIAPVALTDAGDYSVEFTVMPGGEVITSEVATITVNDKPSITTDPIDVDVNIGDPISLTVVAQGTGTIAYQWYKDSVEIDGAETDTYDVANAADGDNGDYYCVVSNDCGDVTSAIAKVVVSAGGTPDGVDEAVAGGFVLNTNTPNPFSATTVISFFASTTTQVRLVLTDIYGREIAVLADKTVEAGNNQVTVDAGSLNLNSGVYNYTLTADGYSITKQMVVVK